MTKPKTPLLSILLTLTGPPLAFSYLYIRDVMRGPMDCSGRGVCVDLRGLDDIPVFLVIWYAFCLVGFVASIMALKRGLPYSKVGIGVSLVVALLPVAVIAQSVLF